MTLTVAECGEFHNLGEFYENIPTVDEALAIWKQIAFEANVWEKHISDLTPAEQLADALKQRIPTT